MNSRTIDVRELPSIAFGNRDPMWWAIMLLIAVEGTMLVLLGLAYAYVRDRITPWPPTLMPHSVAWLALVELGLLIASVLPIHIANRSAHKASIPGMRTGLIIGTLLGVLAGACRWMIFDWLPFRWDANAYGSVVWMLLGIQSVHGLTGIIENGCLITLLYRGPIEQKHRVDVSISSILWYFVVIGAAFQFLVVFLEILTMEAA